MSKIYNNNPTSRESPVYVCISKSREKYIDYVISVLGMIFKLSPSEEKLIKNINSKLHEGDSWILINAVHIQKEVSMSRQTVGKAIAGLIDKKILFYTGHRGKYFINRNFLPIGNNFQINYFYG